MFFLKTIIPFRVSTRIVLCLIVFFMVTSRRHASALEMIANIDRDVVTEFGVYTPFPVEVEPAAAPYAIAPDFSNVDNIDQFTFTATELDLLRQNGFVATPSEYKEMFDAYRAAVSHDLPVFVTVDAPLHAYHVLFDYILRTLESEKFYKSINDLTEALLMSARDQYSAATDDRVREATLKNMAYLAIAARLLDGNAEVPAEVESVVASELSLIEAHAGINASPIFGYDEDYSQYVPRGHYTLSDLLQRYFKAMMWYGRIRFHSEADSIAGISEAMAQAETRQALLLTRLMDETTTGGQAAMLVWQRLYTATSFFAGKSGNLDFIQYAELARGIYGSNLASVPVDDFADEDKLAQFMNGLDALPDPAIETGEGKGLRFMSQRSIPDSYMFAQLTLPQTSRLFPKGLDVMAVLGSQRADAILDRVFHETDDTAYVTQMADLKAEFAAMDEAVWAQNLYWNWLYCLMPMLASKGEGFPPYMQSEAWADKDLACALGSWAELRHDTILYAWPSGTQGIPSHAFEASCVEPNPWAFGRLAALTRLTIDGLEGQGLLLEDFSERLLTLDDLLLSLKAIAEKELTGQSLTLAERRLLRMVGEPLADVSVTPYDRGTAPVTDTAVVADVYTGGTQCLEEGVGRPLNLYVIIDPDGTGEHLAVALGSAFSYYEFTWPVADRLTDEAWRTMLTGDSPPARPTWMGSYFDLANDRAVTDAENAMHVGVDLTRVSIVSMDPQRPHPEAKVTIRIEQARILTEPLEFMLEARCGDQVRTVAFVPDPPSEEEWVGLFYHCVLDIAGWPETTVELNIYSPDDLEAFTTASLEIDSRNAVPAGLWTLY